MKFIKENGKYIGVVMICVFCSYLTTIATNYIFDSSDVRFDNTDTSLESVNVQDAIDETFHHVTDYNEIKTTIGNSTLTTTNKTLIGGINELNGNLGLPSSASGVTGADAFSKINTLNSNVTTLSDQIESLGSKKMWTPKLYDYNTYIRDFPSSGEYYYYEIGDLVVASIAINNPDLSGISTMIQIRNCPMSYIYGGTIYIADIYYRTMYVQGSGSFSYIRPNLKSSDIPNATAPGMFEMVIFGKK